MISSFYLLFFVVFIDFTYGNEKSLSGIYEPRLLDSETAVRDQFPYVVRIYVQTKSADDVTTQVCTGTIIAHDLILTAAQWVKNFWRIIIVHGDPDHSDLIGAQVKNIKDTCSASKKYFCYYVKTAIIHPKYINDENKILYNAAILKLDTPMPVSDGHQVFQCSEVGRGYPENCTILGWGLGRDTTDHKLHYKTNIRTRTCDEHGQRFHICLQSQHICGGDFGGPLICKNKLYGIASYTGGKVGKGNKCGDFLDYHDYYTFVGGIPSFLTKEGRCKPKIKAINASAKIRKSHKFIIVTISISTHLIYIFCMSYKID